MLVDINLLPQTEKKRSWGLVTFITGLAVIIAIVVATWFYYQSQLDKVDVLKSELDANQKLRQTYESQANTQELTPTAELEQAVTWAETNRKETYLLLDEITSLLPERGFLQNFSYEATGTVSLTVQFDSTRQAADFLNHLQASSFIKNCDLESVSTSDLENDTEMNLDVNKDEELPRYIANYTMELDLEALLPEDPDEEEMS